MKVALIHYHFRIGGVTKVIANQSAALTQLGIEHLVLSAGPEPDGIPHASILELDYLAKAPENPNSLYQKLLATCIEHFGTAPDLWHIHNPTLGKNILFPQLIQDIAKSQTSLVLQPHDFAEDNRPSNYPLLTGESIYPLAPQIHYAFINSRDKGLLEQAGLPSAHSHLLPNAVAINDSAPSTPNPHSEGHLVLYPVRGIRRKNLGEIVLLSALAPPDTKFAVSLSPENPHWQAIHNRWSEFAAQHHLPIQLGVTNRLAPDKQTGRTYEDWLTHATHLITTSIAEGFGLAFLEPALHRRPLLGRNLPEITRDFEKHGIQPGRLYHHIPIPLSALDSHSLREHLAKRLKEASQQYSVPFEEQMLEKAWEHLTDGDQVDFGNLPESFQEKLVCQHLNGKADFFLPLQQWLADTLLERSPTVSAEQLAAYDSKQSQIQLAELYQRAITAAPKPSTWIPKANILAQYLTPERFHFLRS